MRVLFVAMLSVTMSIMLFSCYGQIGPAYYPPTQNPKTPTSRPPVVPPPKTPSEPAVTAADGSTEPVKPPDEPSPDQMSCDPPKVMAKYNCTGCHGAGGLGQLDLLSPGVANRLVGVSSKRCGEQKLIDEKNPGASMLLQVLHLDVKSKFSCSSFMPPSGPALSQHEKDCMRKWVDQLIIEKKNTPPPTDLCSGKATTPAHTQLAKVKSLLLGTPVTRAELDQLSKDPKAMKTIIDGWLNSPKTEALFYAKLGELLPLLLQQTGVAGENSFAMHLLLAKYTAYRNTFLPKFEANAKESISRTALAIIKEGRPWTEILTTRRFMMTSGLLAFYAYNFDKQVDDKGWKSKTFATVNAGLKDIEIVKGGAIPRSESLDPKSPQFMRFTDPKIQACLKTKSHTMAFTQARPVGLWLIMMGYLDLHKNERDATFNVNADCLKDGTQASIKLQPVFESKDFEDWRWVEIRKPSGNESPTPFYRMDTIRKSNILLTPHEQVGFLTSPAFHANWQTNEDNDHRLTINQILIVALGSSFDGADNFVPVSTKSLLDEQHAAPGSECWSCHKTLDPMKQLLRQSLTYNGFHQRNEEIRKKGGVFSWYGVEKSGNGVVDLAKYLSEAEEFPKAWAQKLCSIANSAPCPEDSPVFKQVVQDFVNANYNFKVLVRELYGSALVTNAKCVPKTTADSPGVSRVQHFCNTLQNRLQYEDACRQIRSVSSLLTMLPAHSYTRGEVKPLTIRETNIFVTQTYEAICREVAKKLVVRSASKDPRPISFSYNASQPDQAFKNLVEQLMGIPPNDPRYAPLLKLLKDHFTKAKATKTDDTGQPITVNDEAAMESAFMLACMSPSVTGLGF